MNKAEKQTVEYKDLKKIRNGKDGFKDLSITCVALANAQGGKIFIGFDDKSQQPLPKQEIKQEEVNKTISRLRGLCFNVALSASEIKEDENGSQYFLINVSPSLKSIASTSEGKFYIRVADKCEPVRSEDIQRLAFEKSAFQWELVCTKTVKLSDIEPGALSAFADQIRSSDRVSPHIQQMTDVEIGENYNLSDGEYLTFLGVLWLGNAYQRSRITYPITVQYIVYDEFDRKIKKRDWHDNLLNPAKILLDIEKEAAELRYFYELPDGLFRKQVYHYNPKVIRELLLNAFAHKNFTISGDIMIEVYPDHLEITNPGGLPLGVNKDNILHQCQRRNPHFIRIMHDLKLMEGEGSGYDLIYELNARDSKKMPEIETNFNSTKVIQYSEITSQEVLSLIDYVLNHYELSQKDIIALGLVAQYQKLLSTELTELLQLSSDDRLRSYTDRLLKNNILITRGIKKGTEFLINQQLINNARLNVKTTLKTVEPYTLEALISEDLRRHPKSKVQDIANRLPDIDLKEVRKFVYAMVKKGTIDTEGKNRGRVYFLPNK